MITLTTTVHTTMNTRLHLAAVLAAGKSVLLHSGGQRILLVLCYTCIVHGRIIRILWYKNFTPEEGGVFLKRAYVQVYWIDYELYTVAWICCENQPRVCSVISRYALEVVPLD